ncbi:hypothetical protein JXO52_06645 [bacterium]|nr:hypothetical protein [bacterium]
MKAIRTVVFFFIAVCLLSGGAAAQDRAEKAGMGYSIFGQSYVGIDDLNEALKGKGYGALSDKFFSVGGGGHTIVNGRWILGGEGHTLLGDAVVTGDVTSSLMIGYGFFDIGYLLFSKADLNFYPLLGIGGGGMSLNIGEDIAMISMDEALDNPNRGISLSTAEFLLNIGVGLDYLIAFGRDETGRGGMLLGVRAGYTFSPFSGGWSVGDVEVTGAPEIGITGPYIRIMIGGGGVAVQNGS